MNNQELYKALRTRFNKRFDQYEELIEAVNTMTENVNIIRTHNFKNPLDFINFTERVVFPKYNKKQVDSNITDIIIQTASLEKQIQKLVDHKNVLIKELMGS